MLPNLKVENLSSVRSEKVIFDNINFDVMPGQNIEIIGSNGSGKTTLLRTILGLINQDKGQILWLDDDDNYNKFRTFDCFYQGHQLGIKNLLTVYENLQLTKNSIGMPPEEIYNLIFMLLTYQCILFRDWNTLLKYFSWSHFCHFLFVLFQAVKVDARESRNNFSRGLEMLEMLEND